MEKRRYGEVPTLETRHDANESVDKRKRYAQILSVLSDHPGLTAKEIAEIMRQKGQLPTNERNFTAPRLTELVEKGFVEPVGKKVCQWSGKTVAVYSIRRDT